MIKETILQVLSNPLVTDQIMDEIMKLSVSDSLMANLNYLAIVPDTVHHLDPFLIFAVLKNPAYFPDYLIGNVIKKVVPCQEDDFKVINSADAEEWHKYGGLSDERYQILTLSCIKIQDLNVKTIAELKSEFEARYREFKKQNVSPSKHLGTVKSVRTKVETEPVSCVIKYKRNKDIRGLRGVYAERMNELFAKDKFTLKLEENLNHLKYLANKHYKEIPEETCTKIIEELEQIKSEDIKKGKTTLLHLVAKRDVFCHSKKISISESMAIIKLLLGVDPNTTTNECLKIGTSKIKDVDCLDEDGKTALHLAASVSGGIMYWLLVLDAEPNIPDKNKKTALDYIPYAWTQVYRSIKQYIKHYYSF